MRFRPLSRHLFEAALVCAIPWSCGTPAAVDGAEESSTPSVADTAPVPGGSSSPVGGAAPTVGTTATGAPGTAPAANGTSAVPSSTSGEPEPGLNEGGAPGTEQNDGMGGVANGGEAGGADTPSPEVTPSFGGVAAGSGGQGGTSGAAGLGGTNGGGEGGGAAGAGGDSDEPTPRGRVVSFGTLLDPDAAVSAAEARAAMLADPSSETWQAKGDQRRRYFFDETNSDEPYRLYVPTNWDGQAALPLVMFLHGAGSDENTYVDQNGGQMLDLAQQHGFLLVSAFGADGAYGNFLRLSAPFGNEAGAAELMAQVTDDSERANQLSEQDVLNVLELVLAEYPIDRAAMFLTGHSMGSGGTWYIGGKYASYWRAIAPMSGPFVQETGYPWEDLRPVSILVSEGTQTPSLEGSHLLAEWLGTNDFDAEYLEVDADHGGMVPLVLPDVFDFFENARE